MHEAVELFRERKQGRLARHHSRGGQSPRQIASPDSLPGDSRFAKSPVGDNEKLRVRNPQAPRS
jgi:hypothetical protein